MKKYTEEEAKEILLRGEATMLADDIGGYNFEEVGGDTDDRLHYFTCLEGRGMALVEENQRLKYSPSVLLK